MPTVTTGRNTLENFELSVRFGVDQTLIEVLGMLDDSNAHILAEFLDASIAGGSDLIVIHLEDLNLAESIGIRVITEAGSRLFGLGGKLALRTSPELSRNLIKLKEYNDLIELQEGEPLPKRLGSAQPTDDITFPTDDLSYLSKQQLRGMIAIPSNRDVVDGMLRLLLGIAQVAVSGADGVSVSLRRQGHLSTVAASDQTISAMDANQYLTGEGPCVDASVTGRWFHAESLLSESRWPQFTPGALDLGINSILSLPLLADGQPVGALNIYSRTASVFAPEDQRLAAIFAAEASSILTVAGANLSEEQLSHQISNSLRIRRLIAQAEGVIMERQGVSANVAYSKLLDRSQRTNQPLRELAKEIVASTQAWIDSGEDQPSATQNE